ncbi:hypothetical protein TSO221_33250 [Azospirillum sp. TSO22-1]|nr:hypothetical protein TSO221_33250 [Azospirillum sp. TSO22-1]
MSHPLLREGRDVEVAQEYIQACVAAPEDLFRRRRAVSLLGEMTSRHLETGGLPQEVIACFWRFVEAVPAFRGQADSLSALDQGPRGPVLAAMAEAVDAIRVRARRWAEGVARRQAAPRHLLLVTLPFSGVSAIAPILEEYLKAEGFALLNDVNRLPGALADADAGGPRVFAWFHAPHEAMEPYLRRPDTAVVYLHRDPRDVVISSLCQGEPSPGAVFAGIFGYRLDELLVDCAPYFQALAAADAAAWTTTFPAMKADVPGCALRILGMLDLEPDEARVRALAEAYSFRALAGRREGEGAKFQRLGPYVVRKGTSGQWRERFDRTCAVFFAAKYGHLLLAAGWTGDMDWIDEVQG